jgi:hypothetical protein
VQLTSQPDQIAGKTFVHLPTGANRFVRDSNVIAQLERDPDYVVQSTVESEALANVDRSRLPEDSSRWFVDQRLGLGTVRAFRRVFDPAGTAISWRMLLGFGVSPPNSASPQTPLQVAMNTMRGWGSRHGMTADTANYDFANLLVPGVGQAPVTEFRILITLFVLAIGPGNYWLLKRTNRLHLLVLTVPLLAAVLTISLFAYALISDGLSTRVRIRSYSVLDQRTGDAVCWSWLSYYAGLAPSSGLTLPDDVAVYPILSGWNESADGTRSNEIQREMEWRPAAVERGGEQRLTHGWLRSRTPTQYLTVRSRTSPHRLVLRRNDDRLVATNELGAGIQYVAVVDREGNFFAGESVAEGATLPLEPATQLDVLRKLRPLVLESKPEKPIALAEEGSPLFGVQRRQRRWNRRRYRLEYSTDALMGNLLEESIAALIGTQGRAPLDLPPRSYVAITEAGPEVAIGVPNATELESFHVLVGKW